MISLLQKNKKLGEFTTDQIREMLARGQIDGSCYYWMQGMKEWRPFTRAILAPNFRPEEQTKRTSSVRVTPAKQKRRKSTELPLIGLAEPKPRLITEQQRAFLKFHGVRCNKQMSRMEASGLIERILNDPNHDGVKWAESGYGARRGKR